MKDNSKAFKEEERGYVAEFLDKPNSVASATDETGLMPTPPDSKAESDSYSDIVDVPMQFDRHNKVTKVNGEK